MMSKASCANREGPEPRHSQSAWGAWRGWQKYTWQQRVPRRKFRLPRRRTQVTSVDLLNSNWLYFTILPHIYSSSLTDLPLAIIT